MSKPMTISVTLAITLKDPDEWTTTFGIEGRPAIRQDVKEYIENGVRGMGAFGNGEIEADVDLTR